jgi:hypothetical protein
MQALWEGGAPRLAYTGNNVRALACRGFFLLPATYLAFTLCTCEPGPSAFNWHLALHLGTRRQYRLHKPVAHQRHACLKRVPSYFRARFFLRGAASGDRSALVQAVVSCLAFFAASRFTAALAWALADPATLFAALRNMLINGFFMIAPTIEEWVSRSIISTAT